MKIGLYFGSFNPIHIGHMAIANYMLEYTNIDQLWFVVSPQNPIKEKKTLLADYHRLELTRLAVNDDPRFSVSDIEYKMPIPSYTIDTICYLEEKHPGYDFNLVMGADGLMNFNKWKNAELLSKKCHRLVYPRPGVSSETMAQHKNITIVNAPQIEISSSFIRKGIEQGKDLKYFLPREAYEYIKEMHFYEKK